MIKLTYHEIDLKIMQTKTAILSDLSHRGLLQIVGDGAKKLLQGQFTCDLEQVTTTQSQLGAHCNPQGRVISFFRIFLYENDYFLSLPRAMVPIALAALQKYAVFFKVKLTDASDQLQQLGYFEVSQGFQQFIGRKEELQRIAASLKPAENVSIERWQLCTLRNLIPAIYPETTGKFLPHELNLPALKAVSFDKGCYTGQEIIARMEYRGKLKNHLYLATMTTDQPLARGQDIVCENTTCGNIVDVCSLGYNNYELLVIAPENYVTTKTLQINTDRLEFEWQKN